MPVNVKDEYLLRRANLLRNILLGETDSLGDAATVCWILIASFALETSQSDRGRAAAMILGEAAVLAADVQAGRLNLGTR